MEDVYIEMFSDLAMILIVIIFIFYLTYRDNKRQIFLDERYDKLISRMIDNIGQQQSSYKIEIISEIRELSIYVAKVFTGIEKVSLGVNQIQQEVGKVTEEIKNVSFGEERVVSGVEKVAEEVTKVKDEVTNVTSGVSKVVSSLESITEKVDQELEAGRTK